MLQGTIKTKDLLEHDKSSYCPDYAVAYPFSREYLPLLGFAFQLSYRVMTKEAQEAALREWVQRSQYRRKKKQRFPEAKPQHTNVPQQQLPLH